MAQPDVTLQGVRAFMRDVVKLSGPNGQLTKAIQVAAREVAEPIAAATRSRLPQSDRRDAITGQLAGDVRVTASRGGAAVRMGRAKIRYAGWIEFGGHRRAPHHSYREVVPIGRYLFPAAREVAPQTLNRFLAAASDALRTYPWTNQTDDPGGVHD
jgi:hypothetical protein